LPVPEAVGQLVRRVGGWAYANEQPLRTLLRISLDTSTGVRRPGHRRDWIREALAPVRNDIDTETYSKLSRALTLLLGIDPVVVMKDIAGASRFQALDALEWSARTLVEAALNQKAKPDVGGKTASRGEVHKDKAKSWPATKSMGLLFENLDRPMDLEPPSGFPRRKRNCTVERSNSLFRNICV
jgi:hypothetical protein